MFEIPIHMYKTSSLYLNIKKKKITGMKDI